MKIVFTVDALINAGTEKSIYELALILKQQPDITITVIYFYPFHGLAPAFKELSIDLYFLDVKGRYNFVDGYFKLRKVIKKIKPDIIVSSLYRANILSRLVSKNLHIPLVGTFVNNKYSKFLDANKKKTLTEKMFFLLDKSTAAIPDCYISNSDSIAETNSKALNIPQNKIKTIYRGRNADHIPLWKRPEDNDTFEFISVGRLLYQKGYEELLKAFSRLKKDYPAIRLTIYGEGIHRTKLSALLNELNIGNEVSLPGNVPFVYQQFSKANCFVFPSHDEGFSGALVEAMMSGIPIVSSDIPMNLEAVKDGFSGKTFKVKDAESLYQNMKWVFENYEKAIENGSNARVDAYTRFEINAIAAQYLQLLKETTRK